MLSYRPMEQGRELTNARSIGQRANELASLTVFARYRTGLATATVARHDDALKSFAEFLDYKGAPVGNLANDPREWAFMTWGLAEEYLRWVLGQGYAIGTINGNLTIVRRYAHMASKAGIIPDHEAVLIAGMRGISPDQAINLDKQRDKTRIGDKKPEANSLTAAQRRQLFGLPNLSTAAGRRDALMLRLLFVYTLRVSEVLALAPTDVDVATGLIKVTRIKTKRVQRLRLRGVALQCLQDYLAQDAPQVWLFPPSRKGGKIVASSPKPMSRQGAFLIVQEYGEAMGISMLSPHDGRHTATTLLADQGVTFDKIRDARGDAKASTMALNYIRRREVANDDIPEDVFGDGK